MISPSDGRPLLARRRAQVLVLGGGFAGATIASKLGDAAMLVSPQNSMLYTPMLPEAASGTLESRHVVVPLRAMCPRATLILGSATAHDAATRCVRVATDDGEIEVEYQHLVVTVGSISRTMPIPGLAEHAVGFKNYDDALYLRNQVLRQLELADNETDDVRAEEHLGFVFVGAGYAGGAARAELQDLATDALRYYPRLRRLRQRWVLIDVAETILPNIPSRLGEYAAEELKARGVEIRTGTRLESAHADHVVLEDGTSIPAHTLVWSAGVAPHPLLGELGLPVLESGHVAVDEHLRVTGYPDIWACGDAARVPNTKTPGQPDPPTSQHALRQARQLAANLIAVRQGREPEAYGYSALGQVATLGRYKGIAAVLDFKFSGFLGWFITRTYHLYAMPLASRRVRVLTDWTLAFFFRRDVVALGSPSPAPTLASQQGSGTPD